MTTDRRGGSEGVLTSAISVRELTPDDWQRWRDIRLAALSTDPDAFGSRYADWADAEEPRWRARLTDVPVTAVAERGGRDVGVACLALTAGAAELISLWVAPDVRGSGIGDALVRHIISRSATLRSGMAVGLAVKTSNRHARRLYERNGFVIAGPNPDDESETLMSHAAPG